jgi:small-conductance mechanosensitive channel
MLEIGNWVHADQSTGRVLHVPNGLVFKNPVANFDEAFGCIWNELEVTVTFESNWRRAKGALEEIAAANAGELEPEIRKRIACASESMHIQFSKLTPVVWTTVVDSGVKLTIRYLCKPRERRVTASNIWEQVLDSFATMPDVDLAYPTMRRFDHATEGKTSERQSDLRHRVSMPGEPSSSQRLPKDGEPRA